MPTIEFEGAGLAGDKRAFAPEGGELVDICDRVMAPIPFSCRSASCGTCHVLVLEGAELLEKPNSEEEDLLDIIDAPPGSRLACQARVKPGPGLLRLRPAGR